MGDAASTRFLLYCNNFCFHNVSGQVAADSGQPYWMGLHDRNGEGKFEWLDEKNVVRTKPGSACHSHIAARWKCRDPWISLS